MGSRGFRIVPPALFCTTVAGITKYDGRSELWLMQQQAPVYAHSSHGNRLELAPRPFLSGCQSCWPAVDPRAKHRDQCQGSDVALMHFEGHWQMLSVSVAECTVGVMVEVG